METTFQDLTIKQFREIQKIMTGNRGGKEDLDKWISILAVIEGKEEEYYYNLPLDALKQQMSKLSFLKEEFKRNKLDDTYTVKGVKYKLTMSARQMTAGQYIDYTNLLAEQPDDYAALLATILIPKGKKYGEGYDVAEVATTLNEHFKIADAMAICFFFTQLLNILTTVTLESLIQTLKKEKKKETDPARIGQIEKSIKAISGLPS